MAPRARDRPQKGPGTKTASVAEFRRALKGSYRAHQDLQRAVLELCALRGVPAVPIHTGPRVAPRAGGGFELRGNRAQRGVSDVLACLPPSGRLALIELKTGGARRSLEQARVHERFHAAGALCLVVRSIADFEPYLAGGCQPTEQR
jgi:hypothetical protein